MSIKSIDLNPERPDVLRSKRNYGMWYGIIVGLSFAIFTWGVDGFILNNYHGLQPWIKFAIGAFLCMVIGGVTGWLSAKLGKAMYSVLLWLVATSIYAWLIVNLPLVILPKVLVLLEPQISGLLNYAYFDNFGSRVGVAYTWIAIFILLAGLLQIPLSDSAVFSSSLFGKIAPFFVVTALMATAGSIVDNGLINEPLRGSTVAIDNTIQYILDNQGKEIDKAEARRMHTGAFRAITDSVTQQRKLIVSGYDEELGEINILVIFERDLVDCQVFYNQPITCKIIEPTK